MKFKSHKTTVVLHIDPLQSIQSIKEELLRVLTETQPQSLHSGTEMPTNASSISLAKPIEGHDPSSGWTELFDADGNITTGNEPLSKKRKVNDGGVKIQDQCMKTAGIKDGATLAYRFDDGTAAGLEDDRGWTVAVPNPDEGLSDG